MDSHVRIFVRSCVGLRPRTEEQAQRAFRLYARQEGVGKWWYDENSCASVSLPRAGPDGGEDLDEQLDELH